MKFAHIADCHIGAWRDEKLNEINIQAFEFAIKKCIEERVDFVLIAGDLFNTPLPAIDRLKSVVVKLKELKDLGIPVYGVPGSHDFSPSGKTMIDVLESAGLFKNVCKGCVVEDKLRLDFVTDKTGVKITGIIGKKGMLDKKIYENLDLESLENQEGKKIFLFHTLITELKPKHLEKMDSQELSMLPKGFDYYAGGHPHIVSSERFGSGYLCYPGPLFPNNFSELEKLGHGGFYLVEDFVPKYIPVKIVETESISVDANHKTPVLVQEIIKDLIGGLQLKNKLVTIRVRGRMESGKRTDIDFKEIFSNMYERGAFFIMKNTNMLETKEFEQVKVETDSVENVEEKLIKEHVMNEGEEKMVKELITILSKPKGEGEKVADFNKRIVGELNHIIDEPFN